MYSGGYLRGFFFWKQPGRRLENVKCAYPPMTYAFRGIQSNWEALSYPTPTMNSHQPMNKRTDSFDQMLPRMWREAVHRSSKWHHDTHGLPWNTRPFAGIGSLYLQYAHFLGIWSGFLQRTLVRNRHNINLKTFIFTLLCVAKSYMCSASFYGSLLSLEC